MVPVARKNLLAEKARLLMAVGGVAFAVFLMVLIQGVFFQLRSSLTAFIDEMPAQLWVAQDGAFDVWHSDSNLDEDLAGPIAGVPGVAAVEPVVTGQLEMETRGGHVRVVVAGIQTDQQRSVDGSPFGLDAVPGPGEVVVSDMTMRQAGLEVGDTLSAAERGFVIAGASRADAGFRGFAFLQFEDAQDILVGPGRANFLTVFLDDPSQSDSVAEAIGSRLPQVSVFTKAEFADSSREEMGSFTPVLAVLMIVSFIVGAAVISLTIYTATVEKAREFGVMKAIGATAGQLYRVVISQSFAVGILGFAVGVPMAIGAAALIERLVPEFLTMFRWEAILALLASVLAMSLIAAYLPVRTVARVDPAVVFRA
jgi:putative ABC transport system permease protein